MGGLGGIRPPEVAMSRVSGIAQSGLDVESRRLAVSAHNVANALTGGFVPSQVAAEEGAKGGVTAAVGKAGDPLAEARADEALLATSGTDLAKEVLAQRRAALAYEANLAVLAQDQETFRSLLDATKK